MGDKAEPYPILMLTFKKKKKNYSKDTLSFYLLGNLGKIKRS